MRTIVAILLALSVTLPASHSFSAEKNVVDLTDKKAKEKSPCDDMFIFSGTIGMISPAEFYKSIVKPCLSKDGPGATVMINSQGGDAASGYGVFDTVQTFGDATKLTTIAIGRVGSAAVLMFLTGKKAWKITCNSSILIHEVRAEFITGRVVKSADAKETVNLIKFDQEAYIRIMAQSTGQTVYVIAALMKRGALLDAKEAKRLGFATEIIGCP